MILLTGLLVLLVLLVHLYIRYSYWGRHIAKIPGHANWPLLGDFYKILNFTPESAFKYVRESNVQFGRIFKNHMFFLAAVNIHHPDDVEELYSTTLYNEKWRPYHFLKPWLHEGLLISNGEKWKQRRKLLTPSFHFNILKKFQSIFNEQTELFLKRIEAEVDKEKTEIMPIITRVTLNIMCETSMGITVQDGLEAISTKYFYALCKLANIILRRYFTIWYHFDWIYNFSWTSKQENSLLKDLHCFTKNIVMKRKEFREQYNAPTFNEDYEVYQGKRLAMLDLLLENESAGKIDLKGIREEVDTFLFEGHDTTSAALQFMIMRIANESEVQENIYKELLQIFGTSIREPTTNDLNEMQYLECCIKEALRLYPSVPFMARYLLNDAKLGGYTVPAGTIIHTHVFDLHRDPEIYPEPEKFDPYRFLKQNIAARHPYAYIPFSAGPRNCIGQKFAMLEIKTVMSGLLRRFRLEPVTTPQELVFVIGFVLKSRDPVYVRFRPRLKE